MSPIHLIFRLFLVGLLIPSATLRAEELRILTHEFPPYNFIKDKQLVGINTDIIAKVLSEENVAYRIEIINWARAQKIVENTANTGLLSAGRSKVRENKYAWIGPLVSSKSFLFRLASRDDVIVRSTEDLTLYRIGLTRKGVMVDTFEEMGLTAPDNLILVSNASDIYKTLFQNRADLIIGSELTTPYNLQKLGYDISAIKPVFELQTYSVRNYLAVNKTFSQEIINRSNQKIKDMWDNGDIDKIVDQYRL